MNRALALTAIALVLTAALSGCRGAGEAREPQPPAAVQTTPAPQPETAGQTGKTTTTGDPNAGIADVNSDLSDVDKMLREMDDQLAKADATPADGD